MKTFYLFACLAFFTCSCSNQKLIIIRGLPGSGKSTFALNYVKINKNTIHIEKDLIRKGLYKEKWQEAILQRDSEIVVLSTQFEKVIKILREGKSVIVANTHLDDRHIPVFEEIAKSFNAKLEIKDLRNTPLDVCIKRDAERGAQSILSIKELHKKYIQ